MSNASEAAHTSTGPVLVTGCSSGIGAATADLLLKAGHTVHATARRTDTLTELEAAGARVLALDVTSEESMVAGVRRQGRAQGRGVGPARSRYVVTPAARAMIAARTLGGDRVWDGIVRQQFKA